MNRALVVNPLNRLTQISQRSKFFLLNFLSGSMLACGFAPFHLPGLVVLGLAILFFQIGSSSSKKQVLAGFIFGLGYFGVGVSWIYVSIHEYGHLNAPIAAFVTLVFIVYLAVYPGLVALFYKKFAVKHSIIFNCFLFSSLWCVSEIIRATLFGGFPWLLIGTSQIDTPLKYLLPLMGIFGVSFLTCLSATYLASACRRGQQQRLFCLITAVLILILPALLKHQEWTNISRTKISVGIIQANLSMRDKWDEALFWKLLKQYQHTAEGLISKNKLIVMPEAAIPVPLSYVNDILEPLGQKAKLDSSAIIIGIPEATSVDETSYFNTMTTLGHAQGIYKKQHLVPFGEFIPEVFQKLTDWLDLPTANMKPGNREQPLISVLNHYIASLICYELAYPQLLRSQLPLAEWIVSISDDGWFGHSFAIYQQLQMAQVLSLQTGRFQVVANNDGLSSVINARGEIVDSLPVFSAGVLNASIYSATGATPWVLMGDVPIILLCFLILLKALFDIYRERASMIREPGFIFF